MIGRTISHYRIVEEISRGGMGIVYRAVDVSLNREVAVKVLPPDLVTDPDRRARFIQEAQAASALEHPNIAVIHEIGEADGVCFIAMELIRGEKLSDVLERGPVRIDRAIELGIEIAEGLSRAHEKGIIHRDLKPANVMLTEYGHAKVIDFGLAKLVEALPSGLSGETGALAHTDPGVMLGTVAYMAPEQARGTKVDHRADIFAFGILLYEMLAAHPPFRAQSGLDTLHAILNSPAPPLPPLASDAAPDMQRVVEKCLEKDPDARYQGMKDLVVDLRAARRRSEASSAAKRIAPGQPSSSRGSRTRAVAAAVIVVVLGLAAVSGLWWRSRSSPVTPEAGSKPSVAVMYFENNTGNTSLDWLRTGLTDMVVTDLSQSPNIEVLGTDRLFQILSELRRQDDRQISFDVVQQVADRAGIQNVVLGSYVKAGDVIRINVKLQEAKTGRIIASERVEAANESTLFSTVDELTRRVKDRFAIRTASVGALLTNPSGSGAPSMTIDRELKEVTTSSIEAYRAYAEGVDFLNQSKPAMAVEPLQRAIALDPAFSMAHAKLSVAYNNLNQPDQAAKYGRLALDRVERLTPRERYYIEGIYYSRGVRDFKRAIESYEKGLALYPDHVSARNNVGLLYYQLGKYREAIPHYEDAVRRRTPFAGTYTNLANAYSALGDTANARRVAEDLIRFNPRHPYGPYAEGVARLRAGQIDEAIAAFDRAIALGMNNDFRPHVGHFEAYVQLRDWAKATAVARRMTAMLDPIAKYLGFYALDLIALFQGHSADALAALEEAYAVPMADQIKIEVDVEAATIRLARGEAKQAHAAAERLAKRATAQTDEIGLEMLVLLNDTAGARDAADASLAQLQRLGDRPLDDVHRRAALQTAGELALQRGDPKSAVTSLADAASMLPAVGFPPPTPPHLRVWWALASAHLALGHDADAEKWFGRIASSRSESVWFPILYVRAHYQLARLAEKRGDTAKAREYFKTFADFWKDGDLDRDRVKEALAKSQ